MSDLEALESALASLVMEAVRLYTDNRYYEPSASAQAEVVALVDTRRVTDLFKQQQAGVREMLDKAFKIGAGMQRQKLSPRLEDFDWTEMIDGLLKEHGWEEIP